MQPESFPPTAMYILDASGLRCPMPVLKAQKQLRTMQTGQMVEVIATDEVARSEIPAFCQQAGHVLHHYQADAGQWRFWIEKGEKAP